MNKLLVWQKSKWTVVLWSDGTVVCHGPDSLEVHVGKYDFPDDWAHVLPKYVQAMLHKLSGLRYVLSEES